MRWVTMSDVYMDKTDVFAPDPKKGESAIAYSRARPDHRGEARRQAQDPRVRLLAAVDRARERDRPADARRVPDAARQHARLVRRRSDRPPDHLSDRQRASASRSTAWSARPRPRSRVPTGRVTRTPVIDGLATFYGARVGYYDVAAKAPNGTRDGADRARGEPRVAERVRHRAVGGARRSAARSSRRPRRSRSPAARSCGSYLVAARDGADRRSSGSPITAGSPSDGRR